MEGGNAWHPGLTTGGCAASQADQRADGRGRNARVDFSLLLAAINVATGAGIDAGVCVWRDWDPAFLVGISDMHGRVMRSTGDDQGCEFALSVA